MPRRCWNGPRGRKAGGFTVEAVKRPGDGDWTEAVLTAIARPGAAPIALASISSVHWSDGVVVDLGRVAPALRASGAALLLDATQSVGVLPLDVGAIDPDFVVFPTYKWLLGPYGRAFLYVAKRHQGCVPLEQTAGGRRAVRAEQTTYMADTAYVDDARRFDMGERDHLVSLEMAVGRHRDDDRVGRRRRGAAAGDADGKARGGLGGPRCRDIAAARALTPHPQPAHSRKGCRRDWSRRLPPGTSTSPLASAACGSARMSTTTRPMSSGSSRAFRGAVPRNWN